MFHAFEKHEKELVCKSVTDHHIHKKGKHCITLQWHFQPYVVKIPTAELAFLPNFYTKVFNKTSGIVEDVCLLYKSSRAPPYFTV